MATGVIRPTACVADRPLSSQPSRGRVLQLKKQKADRFNLKKVDYATDAGPRGNRMQVKRFRASKIHGYLDFNILFRSDLTFLTGINGSGKTSVGTPLNCISQTIWERRRTPSLNVVLKP